MGSERFRLILGWMVVAALVALAFTCAFLAGDPCDLGGWEEVECRTEREMERREDAYNRGW